VYQLYASSYSLSEVAVDNSTTVNISTSLISLKTTTRYQNIIIQHTFCMHNDIWEAATCVWTQTHTMWTDWDAFNHLEALVSSYYTVVIITIALQERISTPAEQVCRYYWLAGVDNSKHLVVHIPNGWLSYVCYNWSLLAVTPRASDAKATGAFQHNHLRALKMDVTFHKVDIVVICC